MLKGVTKRFGEVVAVKDVSLEVDDGSFLVLVGPSGCGKTTTLRCIAGLEHPDEGEIYIGDALVNDVPPQDRNISMVFQSYALYPHMKVYDNIAFPLKMRKVSKADMKERVPQTAKMLHISHLLDRKPKELSGGERQRVALGRAIVRNPEVFLMDEPLSNLDAKLRVYMRAELKRLQKELGITTVYVTHDQVEAMTMADNIAIMDQGILQQLGNASDVFNRPRNLFVAGFIGTPPMNLINCNLRQEDGSFFLDTAHFAMQLEDPLGKAIAENSTSSELILGVRPDDILLGKRRSSKTFIETEVYVTEPTGSEVILDLRMGEEIIKAESSPELDVGIGDKMWIGFKQDKIHVFDKATEKAIV